MKYHPNQRRHLIKHPHLQLSTILIMKKHPWKNPCWTMDIRKIIFRNNQKLHLKCGNEHYQHLYILHSRWLYLLQFEKIGEKIYENLQNSYCTPLEFFVESFFDIWDLKNHGPCNYLQTFYLAALIQKCGEKALSIWRVSKWYKK